MKPGTYDRHSLMESQTWHGRPNCRLGMGGLPAAIIRTAMHTRRCKTNPLPHTPQARGARDSVPYDTALNLARESPLSKRLRPEHPARQDSLEHNISSATTL